MVYHGIVGTVGIIGKMVVKPLGSGPLNNQPHIPYIVGILLGISLLLMATRNLVNSPVEVGSDSPIIYDRFFSPSRW